MKIPRIKILILTFLLLAVAFLGGGVTFFVNRLFHLDTYKTQILANLQQALQRQVIYEKGVFSLRFGPSFVFTKVVIKEKDGVADFVTADRIALKVEILPLLEKKVAFKEIILDHPHVMVNRTPAGLFNFSDLLEAKKEEIPLQIKGIRIKRGNFRFLDRMAAPEGLVTVLEEADVSISRLSRGKHSDIKLSAFVVDEGKRGIISLAGSAQIAPQDKPMRDTLLNLSINAKNMNTAHYWPYYSRYVPFRKVAGYLDIDSKFTGRFSQFTTRGKIKVSGLRFDYPQVFHAVLTPKDLHFSYDMAREPHAVSVKSLDLTVDGLNVKGGCAISDLDSNDPRITAHAITSHFNLANFAQYIPYGIIVKEPADYIEQHIKGGIYKLDDGRLDGRVSQILHMERGENYNVLFIKGRVEQGLVSYGPDVPTFNSIKGTLEMRGKDFNLIGMSGKFGGSPFTLDGKIADYPLDTPSSYPFTMNMTPRQAEIAWLMGKENGQKLTFAGDSVLHMVGTGLTSDFNLAGEWHLSSASYSYPNIINKPAGRQNLLSFKGNITKQEAHLRELRCSLAPLTMTISADYRFTGPRKITANITTNSFQIADLSALVPMIQKYQPGGRCQASLRGEGESLRLVEVRWRGDLNFSNFSFKPSAQISTVSNMTGIIHFTGNSLESSQISAKLGNSIISGRGRLDGFENPSLNLSFNSPSLDMADFGWRSPQKEVRTGKVNGEISLKDNNLQIKSLSAKINNTTLNLKGTVQNLHTPKFDLLVTSPHLEVEDILLMTSLEPVMKKEGTTSVITLKAKVSAASGKIKAIPFTELSTAVLFEDKKLYLQPLTFQVFDGSFSGKMRMDFGASEAPRYQVSYVLENVASESLMQAIGIKKQEITGTLSMTGDLTAKGNNSAQIKQTALGTTKIQLEEGTLRRFATLSKIFSILNVSQLLKFQLPDMVSGGMPYNEINATLSVHDGIVSSNDLFVKSDAMNISAIGSLNLVTDEMNITIGVQPLQTVDKVVSHIPIVGWILTGKEKSLVSAYFEAKGTIDNPTVSPIPVKSLGKGMFDIFKRVFQLPGKLITDTGEVMLGK